MYQFLSFDQIKLKGEIIALQWETSIFFPSLLMTRLCACSCYDIVMTDIPGAVKCKLVTESL